MRCSDGGLHRCLALSSRRLAEDKPVSDGAHNSPEQVEHVKLEKEVLAKLDHPFCNKLVKTFHDDKRLFMLITLCLGGDLLRV